MAKVRVLCAVDSCVVCPCCKSTVISNIPGDLLAFGEDLVEWHCDSCDSTWYLSVKEQADENVQ